jgi:dimethylargininase
MPTAITRAVSPALDRCELTYLERVPIDVARAVAQHDRYCQCLRALGLDVVTLPADPDLADSVFVEDPVVAVDEVAVIARMGAESRRREAESLAETIARFRPVEWMTAPATLEGGDVFRAGRTLFAGLSQRTNAEGIAQLAKFLAPHGYDVRAVEVRGCLHLKSGACYLGRNTVLANRDWIDAGALAGFRVLDVAEPWAADVLAIGETILMPAGFPRTQDLLAREGFTVQTVDVSELQKAEAGVTCMSVILD